MLALALASFARTADAAHGPGLASPADPKLAVGSNDTEKEDDNEPISCNRPLLISLGFEGQDKPGKANLDMCPQVRHSCCTKKDQMNIYENWITNREEERYKAMLSDQKAVYERLMDLVAQANVRAEATSERLKTKKTSNCKVLAKRVTHFQIKTIAPMLMESLDSMQQFFFNTHKGWYCTVCNAKMNPFIDIFGKKLILSHKFCRQITTNSLHVLLYFHIHFIKYLNLISRFVSSCSVKGAYKDIKAEGETKMEVSKSLHNMLTGCKEKRNDKKWMDYCEDICRKFMPFRYSNFFAPNLLKFHRFSKFLTKQLHRLNKEAILLEDEERMKVKRLRVLAEAPAAAPPTGLAALGVTPTAEPTDRALMQPEKPLTAVEEMNQNMADMERFKLDPKVIKSADDALVDLEGFNMSYEVAGINFYMSGIGSDISERVIQDIRRDDFDKEDKANALKDKNSKDKGKPDEDDDEDAVKGASILSLALVWVLVFMLK